MTYKEKVEFLKNYKKHYMRLRFIDDKITSLRANPIGEDTEYHGPGKTVEDYLDEKTFLTKEMRKVETIIDMCDDETERYVLGYKFIEFMSLEKIAPIIGYSFTQTKRIYRNAITNLKI